jgi:SAM-dependent methyltransferase
MALTTGPLCRQAAQLQAQEILVMYRENEFSSFCVMEPPLTSAPIRALARRLSRRIPLLRDVIAERDWLRQETQQLIAERNWLRKKTENLREQVRRELLPPSLVPEIPSELRIDTLCEVTNPARYIDPKWLELHHDLERYSIDKHCLQGFNGAIVRKGWEWTHCLYGLRQLGMLQPEHRAVGVGAGRECVIYYLADHIFQVVATDLYGDVGWSGSGGKEADLRLLEESKKICPSSVDFSKISFESRDGTNLGYPDNSFDFAWSLSSIEHFGGHAAARRALEEMGRVVRPGGVIAVATEMLLLEEHSHPEYFTRSEIMHELIEPCKSGLELIGDVNFDTLTFEYLVDSICVPHGVDRRRRHVVLNDGNNQWTSVLLFFRSKKL